MAIQLKNNTNNTRTQNKWTYNFKEIIKTKQK